MKCSYPLLLDLTGRLVVIIGGGAVALRKLRGLLEAGATRIRCVAPESAFKQGMPGMPGMPEMPEMPEMPGAAGGVELLRERYAPHHLDGASLVFAATDDPEVNAAIVRDAHARNLWVNRADADEDPPGDFATPAVLREGELLVTVSAGGSPALAAAARDAIRAGLASGPGGKGGWARMAGAMKEIRPRVLASGWPIEKRRAAFRDLATPEAMNVLESDGIEKLWRWLEDRHGQVK